MQQIFIWNPVFNCFTSSTLRIFWKLWEKLFTNSRQTDWDRCLANHLHCCSKKIVPFYTKDLWIKGAPHCWGHIVLVRCFVESLLRSNDVWGWILRFQPQNLKVWKVKNISKVYLFICLFLSSLKRLFYWNAKWVIEQSKKSDLWNYRGLSYFFDSKSWLFRVP